jgi:hypothetical protein
MSQLSITYVGAGAASIQTDGGDSRIFHQGSDGGIYEINGTATEQIAPPSEVRIVTPIAATAETAGTVIEKVSYYSSKSDYSNLLPPQISIFYIDPENYIRERFYKAGDTGGEFIPGSIDVKKYQVTSNSGLLYAVGTSTGLNVRVGFQSAAAPSVITEAALAVDGNWNTSVLVV